MHLSSRSEAETQQISTQIMQQLGDHNVICLYGDLGAGKTTFTKGIANYFQLNERDIKSPTYTYVRQYSSPIRPIYHIDLYRVDDIDELLEQEINEIISEPANLVIIEWADRFQDKLPAKRIDIHISHDQPQVRNIKVQFNSSDY